MVVQILIGDAVDKLHDIADDSIHTCITSPPYFGLRDYGIAGQIGGEDSPEEFIAALVSVFHEVKRVLRPDGTLWLNIGDSYAVGKIGRDDTSGFANGKFRGPDMPFRVRKAPKGFKSKDLLMIPSRLVMALQDDGWFLRAEIIWHKLKAMPEPVRDRPSQCHEKIFLLSKSANYFYDTAASPDLSSVWTTKKGIVGGGEARHFATYPIKLIEPCFLVGVSAGGCCGLCGTPLQRSPCALSDLDELFTIPINRQVMRWRKPCGHDQSAVVRGRVLDPFFGSGTTGIAAHLFNQDCIGIEMNPEYGNLAFEKLQRDNVPLGKIVP
jgi:DNA modification methylase